MREQLQSRRDIVPTIRAYNGFKHLAVLLPVRLLWEPWNWRRREPRPPRRPRGDRRSLTPREFEFRAVIINVLLQPNHCYFQLSTRGTQCLCPTFILWSSWYQYIRILYLRRSIGVALRNVTTTRRTIQPIRNKQGTDCLCGEPSRLVSASQLTDLLLGVYDPPAVQFSERMNLDRPMRRLSTTSGGPVCGQDQSLVCVFHPVRPIWPEWTPSEGGLHLVRILVLVVLKKVGILRVLFCHCSTVIHLISPLHRQNSILVTGTNM